VPFLTLDAELIDHSGTVLNVCADPRVVAGANPPEPSRVQQLVSRVRNEPGRPNGLSPHVIAVTCPPRILAEGVQQGRFINSHAPVLSGAGRIIAPYFDLQRQLVERGIERFAGRVATLGKRGVVVEANYVDFDSFGSVVDVTNIRTIDTNRTQSPTDVTSA